MFISEKNIFNHLQELGCCEICSARYFCNKSIDLADVRSYLKKSNIIEDKAEGNSKKIKSNPCLVCLGLLQTDAIDDILRDDRLKVASSYDSKVFTCSISMPACILLREHSMRLYLEEKFPNFFSDENREIPLNRAWKMFVKNPLGEYLGKEFDNSATCDFSINICFDYQNDEMELNALKLMQPQTFKQRSVQRKKYNGELFARKCVVSVLEETCDDTFKQHYTIPPSVATNFVTVKNIECKHNPIYFAGRYLKFSRELCQSPWIIDGKRMLESSVQEIIFENVTKLFSISEVNMKFSASGREDCDVRCVGKGRPFYIEICDPTRHLTRADFKLLEKSINESVQIKVRHLQTVPKSNLIKIKEGEESKTKDYQALCKSKNAICQDQIDKINQMGSSPLVIQQETPIRVLHRRPLAARFRTIHQMKAEAVEGYRNLFILWVNTQAGTYVKEFVHGDFDRTSPNIAEIIEDDVDIVALDVVSINMNWPPEIDD